VLLSGQVAGENGKFGTLFEDTGACVSRRHGMGLGEAVEAMKKANRHRAR